MESLVPLIGRNLLDRNEALKIRIQLIVEEDFGHKLRFVDAGSVYTLRHPNLLQLAIPFTVSIEGAIDSLVEGDILDQIHRYYPTAPNIKASAEHLPHLLKSRAEELSLGHVNGAPQVVRQAVSLIFEHLSDEYYSVEGIAKELGIAKATLDRRFHEWNAIGPNKLRHNIRMCEARRLLIETEWQVQQISEAVGYGSAVAFDHAFHEFWKRSPSQMRVKFRNPQMTKIDA